MFALCIFVANEMTEISQGRWFELPTFVWALGTGVIVRNFLEHVLKVDIFDRAIDVFGNASLSLYLSMALLSLQLWLAGRFGRPAHYHFVCADSGTDFIYRNCDL
jgi:Na+/glutamate symporter